MKYYKLADYARLLHNKNMLKQSELGTVEDITIENLTYDSRSVTTNTLFICKGAAFREEYLQEAVSRGAVAYVSERKYESLGDFPHIIVHDIRKAMADLAEITSAYDETEKRFYKIADYMNKVR